MENIVILDTETTGLDPAKGKLLEIAGILYNIPTRGVLAQTSSLLYAAENPAYEINRISEDALKKMPGSIELIGRRMFIEMMENADVLVAHNADFDKKWIETIPDFQIISRNKQWICTVNDVTWPIRKSVPRNLIHICADLGVPIVNTHRALADCELLLQALECMDDIASFLDKKGSGKIRYHANVSFEQRQIVKDHGFLWDNLKKVWHARLTIEESKQLPFMVYPAEKE